MIFSPAFLKAVIASQLFVFGPMVPIIEVRLSSCGVPIFRLASLCNLDSDINVGVGVLGADCVFGMIFENFSFYTARSIYVYIHIYIFQNPIHFTPVFQGAWLKVYEGKKKKRNNRKYVN